MRDGVVHVIGHLNNRQDPIKLGQVSEQDPVVSFLKVAQNIDIDDRGVATTRDGQEERYLGSVSSLWVHPQDDTEAYLLEHIEAAPSPNVIEGALSGLDQWYGVFSFAVAFADNTMQFLGFPGTAWYAGGTGAALPLPAGYYTVSFKCTEYISGSIRARLGLLYSDAVESVGSYSFNADNSEGDSFDFQMVSPSLTISELTIVETDASYVPLVPAIPEQNLLKKFNTDFTTTDIATLNSAADISYAVINGIVFLSNGVDIGYIENGAFVPFSQTLLRDELPMPAGEYIAYSDNEGVLLVASGSTVYRSKPWNPQVRDARHSEFPMNGKVRMLATVEDGWFVGTEKNVSFAQMDNADGYTFRHVTDSVPPDGAFFKEFHFDEDKGTASQMRVIWASPDGFIEGTSGGGYENHSYPNVSLPEGNKGKVFNRNVNGTNQYLAVIFNPEDDNNYVAPTLLKNRITP